MSGNDTGHLLGKMLQSSKSMVFTEYLVIYKYLDHDSLSIPKFNPIFLFHYYPQRVHSINNKDYTPV